MTTQPHAARRIATLRREMGCYTPRRFNALTRERFLRDRRRKWLARLPAGSLTDAQAAMIQTLAALEWSALAAEDEGGLQGFRESREHRRLFQRLLADFERSLAAMTAQEPIDPAAAIHAHFAARRSGGAAA